MSENENIIAQRKSLVKEIEKLKKEYNSIRDKSEKLMAVAKINEKKAALAQIRSEFIDFQTKHKQ
jgi:septal ring factor EnvC (AmiA/AmiB activator)